MLHDERVGLSSGLGEALLSHLTALFHRPLQQEALVRFEQLQLIGLLQLLFPSTTFPHSITSRGSEADRWSVRVSKEKISPEFNLCVQGLQNLLDLVLLVLQFVAHH